MTTEMLQQVFRLNNEGAALVCSLDLSNTKAAIKHFDLALSIATSCPSSKSTPDAIETDFDERTREVGIWDLCLYSNVPDQHGDDAFYFFDQAVFLRPDIFVRRMGGSVVKTMTFMAAIVTVNTALAQASLTQREFREANRFFCRALHLYAHVVAMLAEHSSLTNQNSKVVLFFVLVAQNNYSLLCLKLGLLSTCRMVQADVYPLLENGAMLLPFDSIPFVDEIYLNTAILASSNTFMTLPAAAA